MAQTYRIPAYGYVACWKLGGSASALSTGQINMPVLSAIPLNPDNNQYPALVNISGYPTATVQNMKQPSVAVRTCYKPSFMSANLCNSFINLGTDKQANQTDRFAWAFKDNNSGSLRIWDWARCNRLRFQQQVVGGPVLVECDWKCRFGDNEAPYGDTDPATGSAYGAAPAFATPSGPDAGLLYGMEHVTISGLGNVRSWTLDLIRGQAYLKYYQSTASRYADEIATTTFSGILSIDQDPGGTAISDTGTVTITIGPASTTGSISLTMLVKRDDSAYPYDISLGNQSARYSLIDTSSGGNPCTIADG